MATNFQKLFQVGQRAAANPVLAASNAWNRLQQGAENYQGNSGGPALLNGFISAMTPSGFDTAYAAPQTYDPGNPADIGQGTVATAAQRPDLYADPNAGQTGGGGDPATQPNMQFWNGQMYDLNNQNDAMRFAQDQDAFYGGKWNDFQSQYNTKIQGDMAGANRDYDAQTRAIRKALTGVDTGEADTLKDLQEGYGLGTVNRQNYFSDLSPNAYQSAQGSSQAYSLGKLNEGSQQTIDAANLNRTDLNATMADTGAAYNDYISQRQAQGQQDLAAQQAQINQYREGGATEFANTAQGRGWDVNAFTPKIDYSAPQVNMSNFTPYLNFQQLSQAPGQAAYGKVLGQQKTTPGSQSVNQYLNYTPKKKEYSSLNQYLGYGNA